MLHGAAGVKALCPGARVLYAPGLSLIPISSGGGGSLAGLVILVVIVIIILRARGGKGGGKPAGGPGASSGPAPMPPSETVSYTHLVRILYVLIPNFGMYKTSSFVLRSI